MDSIFNDSAVSVIASIIGGLVLFLVRTVWKEKADLKAKLFDIGVRVAYQVVNEVASRTENKIDDKIALGLKYLADYLSAHGLELTTQDETKAKLLFQAMHAQERAGFGAPAAVK
jgi:hypothetical protein